MDRSVTWERAGAASGIAFVALLVASFLVIPDKPPALDDPVAEIRSFYVDNSSAFRASVFLTGLAGLFFLCFLGTLGTVLARANPGRPAPLIVVSSGAIVLALAFVNTAVTDALATRIAAESDQAVIRALYDVQAFAITFVAFPIAALVGAVTIASSRPRILPPLVIRLGAVLVPAWLISGCGVFVESGVFSPTGTFGLVVLLAWVAWVLAVSASLLRRSGTATPRDAT
jgi:uncharacterized membrane protein